MAASNGYALIIGIDDYAALDASLGQSPGTSDLRGAVNDACAWYRVARELGIPPGNIRMLTSPVVEAERLGESGAYRAPATHAAILDGHAWLYAEMADTGASGLVFLGGHSVFLEPDGALRFRTIRKAAMSTLLVPGDATGHLDDGGDLIIDNPIDMKAMKDRCDAAGVGDRLTVMMDLCHAPALPRVGRRMRQVLGKLLSAIPVWPRLGHRMLAACGPHQISEEAQFDGRIHGAFTWALTNAFQQWKVVDHGDSRRSTASCQSLIDAADATLKALHFDQRATFNGLPALAALPFFHPETSFDGQTVEAPDRRGPPRQLEPGNNGFVLYQIDLGHDAAPHATPSLGVIICTLTKSPDGKYQKDREYWRIDQTALDSLGSQKVSVWMADCTWDAIGANSGLESRFDWQPSNAHLWIADRIPASVGSCNGAPTAGSLRTRTGGGRKLGLHFRVGTAEPTVLWFNETTDYVFDTESMAQFDSSTSGSYTSQFSASHRIKLYDGGDPNGWYEFTSKVLSTGSMS